MKIEGKTIGLGLAAGALIFSAAACNEGPKSGQAEQSPSALPTASETQIGNSYHLVPVPCETNMPWEGVKSDTTETIIFASIKRPLPTTKPGIGPECWEIVPDNSPEPGQHFSGHGGGGSWATPTPEPR